MDDSTQIIFTVISDNYGGTNRFVDDRVFLVIRYRSGKTELYIQWNKYLDYDYDTKRVRVITKIGDKEPVSESWSSSTNHKATFYRGSVQEFIEKIANNDTLLCETTPYNKNPVTTEFDVRGLKDLARQYIQYLKWDFLIPELPGIFTPAYLKIEE